MAQPTPYSRLADFTDDEANSAGGRSTVLTASLDAELDAIALTLRETLGNLSLIQRDDGEIRDGRVQIHTLAADVRGLLATSGVTVRGDWTTTTTYAVKDIITESGATYICAQDHTAGTFSTDLTDGKWVLIANAPGAFAATSIAVTPAGNISSTDAQAALEELDAEKLAAANNLSDVADAPTALNNIGAVPRAGGTMTGLLTLSGPPTAAQHATTKDYVDDALAGLSFGQCRLGFVSSTQVRLSRFNGNKLFINGAWHTIPGAGVTLANSGLAANTTYYVYAFMSGATMTLEASATARTTDATHGHQVKNGDPTRTLVGIVRTNTSSQFVETTASTLVLSWFNRRPKTCRASLTTARTSSSTVAQLINSEADVQMLAWSDSPYWTSCRATMSTNGAGTNVFVVLQEATSNVSLLNTMGGRSEAANASIDASGSRYVTQSAETNLIHLRLFGFVSGDTGSWSSSSAIAAATWG